MKVYVCKYNTLSKYLQDNVAFKNKYWSSSSKPSFKIRFEVTQIPTNFRDVRVTDSENRLRVDFERGGLGVEMENEVGSIGKWESISVTFSLFLPLWR